jgi:hypothetical protein
MNCFFCLPSENFERCGVPLKLLRLMTVFNRRCSGFLIAVLVVSQLKLMMSLISVRYQVAGFLQDGVSTFYWKVIKLEHRFV